jgi:hypothetical protein
MTPVPSPAFDNPVTVNPNIARCRHRRRHFVSKWRRRRADGDSE